MPQPEEEFQAMIVKLKPVDAELARCMRALRSMVPSIEKAETLARIDELLDERARIMGVPKEEIAQINKECDLTDEEIAAILGSKPE